LDEEQRLLGIITGSALLQAIQPNGAAKGGS